MIIIKAKSKIFIYEIDNTKLSLKKSFPISDDTILIGAFNQKENYCILMTINSKLTM